MNLHAQGRKSQAGFAPPFFVGSFAGSTKRRDGTIARLISMARVECQHSLARRLKGKGASVLISLCIIAGPAHAQLREAEKDGYALRANVANTQTLPASVRADYGLPAEGYLINVVILKQDKPIQDQMVEAEVSVVTTDLLGARLNVAMRAVKANSGISYMGTVTPPLNAIVLDFEITARPAGSDTRLDLQFRERLPRAVR